MKIEKLQPQEAVWLDPDRVVALYAELGPRDAEQVLGVAMEEMAIQISTMQVAANRGVMARVISAARDLVKIALPLGMDALAQVARDVEQCAEIRDAVGLAATLNRLVRIGDRSLTAIWDGPEIG